MLEYLKRDKMERCEDIEKEFENCMYIIVDTNNDIENLMGKLYCVSHSSKSFEEINAVFDKLWAQGRDVSLLGLYKDAWSPGLHYIIKEDCEV